jgi:anti-anti-sigma factor
VTAVTPGLKAIGERRNFMRHSTEPDLNTAFEVTTGNTPDCLVVRLTGELDASTADTLHALITDVDLNANQTALVNLSDLTFCDAAGLRELLQLHTRLRRTHRTVRFHGASPTVQRLMHITGMDDVVALDGADGSSARP